jgi:ribonuclease HI
LALLYALEYIKDKYPNERIRIFSDSQLIVKQMKGDYRITTDNLRALYNKCKPMMNKKIRLIWISRDFNLAGHVLEK